MSNSDDQKMSYSKPITGTIIFIFIVIFVNWGLTAYLGSILMHGDVFLPWQWVEWSHRYYNFDPSLFTKIYILAAVGMGTPLIIYTRCMSRYFSNKNGRKR